MPAICARSCLLLQVKIFDDVKAGNIEKGNFQSSKRKNPDPQESALGGILDVQVNHFRWSCPQPEKIQRTLQELTAMGAGVGLPVIHKKGDIRKSTSHTNHLQKQTG
jgi:hypothetical protein